MSWEKVEEKIERMEERLEEKLEAIQKELSVYNTELRLHIEGVKQNRESIKILASKVEPIERHVFAVQAVIAIIKWVGAAGTLAAIAGVAKYFGVM